MGLKQVRITRHIHAPDCSLQWTVEDTSGQWRQRCCLHDVAFQLGTDCPSKPAPMLAGEELWLEGPIADRLVQEGRAVYPQLEPAQDESIPATLARANQVFEAMGLPAMERDAYKTYQAVPRIASSGGSGGGHYYGAREQRLAADLGLSPADVAAMRKVAKR